MREEASCVYQGPCKEDSSTMVKTLPFIVRARGTSLPCHHIELITPLGSWVWHSSQEHDPGGWMWVSPLHGEFFEGRDQVLFTGTPSRVISTWNMLNKCLLTKQIQFCSCISRVQSRLFMYMCSSYVLHHGCNHIQSLLYFLMRVSSSSKYNPSSCSPRLLNPITCGLQNRSNWVFCYLSLKKINMLFVHLQCWGK